MTDTSYITFDIFRQFKEITCAFSTRLGGYSSGPFNSQNMGNVRHDLSENVMRNRLNYFDKLDVDPRRVIYPGQIHSASVGIVYDIDLFPDTDALITDQQNIFLTVQTADCFPVFLYEPICKVIGLIHAGWRGTRMGIIPKTIDIMRTKFSINPFNLFAVMGPGLQKECFEVREDVFKQFPENYCSLHPDKRKRFLDLENFIYNSLLETGILMANIEKNSICTKCSSSLYYSFRRDGERSGRMMGILGIRKDA